MVRGWIEKVNFPRISAENLRLTDFAQTRLPPLGNDIHSSTLAMVLLLVGGVAKTDLS
jgi:hypothetical protein